MSVSKNAWLRAALLCAEIAAVLLIARPSLSAGFPLDDAWIHQSAALNFAQNGTLGLVPGKFGSGTTSTLWALLLASNHAFFHFAPSAFSAVVNIALLGICGQLLFGCALRDGWTTGCAWSFALLFSVSPNLCWFAVSGMEVCLFCALLMLAVTLWYAERLPRASALATGFTLALLFLTRPESLVAAVALLATRGFRQRHRQRIAYALFPVGLVVLGYFAQNYSATGRVGPSTTAGRRWMWLQESADWPWHEQRLQLIKNWLDRLWEFTLGAPWLPLFWVLVGLSCFAAVRLIQRRGRISALVIVAGAHALTYLLWLPVEGHGGRYQPLIAALWLPLAAHGVSGLMDPLRREDSPGKRIAEYLPWLLPAAAFPALASCFGTWASAQSLAVSHINNTEVALGRWAAKLPREARIASFDVGGLSYFGEHSILDLGGLSDPAPLAAIRQGRIRQVLEQARIDYLVVPMGYSGFFPDPWSFLWRLGIFGEGQPRMHELKEFSSPVDIWEPGLRATLHCAPRQIVYQLDKAVSLGGKPHAD